MVWPINIVCILNHTQVTRDPYSIATTADGMRSLPFFQRARSSSLIGALKRQMRLLALGQSAVQAVIYEMHLRGPSRRLQVWTSLYVEPITRACQEGTINSHGDATAFDCVS